MKGLKMTFLTLLFSNKFAFSQVATEELIDRLIQVNLPSLYSGPCIEYDQYVSVYREEFNGDSLDHWFWRPNMVNFHHSPSAVETDEYNSENQLVLSNSNNGTLTIKVENNPIYAKAVDFLPDSAFFEGVGHNLRTWAFRSGAITTNWKFRHGRFVLRTQIPAGRFMWPAYWFYGTCGSEIDGFEFQVDNSDSGHDKKPSFSIHKAVAGCAGKSRGETRTINVGNSLATNFHTYWVDWDDFVIRFSVDNQVRATYYRYYKRTTLGPFLNRFEGVENCGMIQAVGDYYEDPYYPLVMMDLIINAAVMKNATPSAFPREMKLDYLDMKDFIDCQSNKLIQAASDIEGYDATDNIGDRTVTAGSIVVDALAPLLIKKPSSIAPWLPGDFIIMTAAEEIVIRPGFEVEPGGNLIAQIRPCATSSKNETLENESMVNTYEPIIFYSLGDSLFESDTFGGAFDVTPDDIQIFPNPAYETFQLIGLEKRAEVVILDVSGRKVSTVTLNEGESELLSLAGLKAGLYLVEVARESHPRKYLKLIKL